MTETVCLVMPAATLTSPAAPRASRARQLQRAEDRDQALASIHKADSRLREIEAKAQKRARALGLPSSAAIVARAQHLARESGGTLSNIEAVDEARAEAGLSQPTPRQTGRTAGAADADIVASARRLIAESGNTLSAPAAVDKARAELATLASGGRDTREWEAVERHNEQHGRVEEALRDTAAALERRLMAHARELIADARRAIAKDPFEARELAIRAREAMNAITPLFARSPDHEPARRILEGAGGRAA